VVAVHLGGTRATDADLKELAGLRHLQALYLEGTAVTDAGLKRLAGLEELERLRLSHTLVGDAGLKELAGLKRLRTLGLRGTGVTDVGLKELAGLESLREVDLTDSRVTGPGLTDVARRKHLRTVSIPDGKEPEAIKVLQNAIWRYYGEFPGAATFPTLLAQKRHLPGWGETKARLDRKSGHWIVASNKWAVDGDHVYPYCFTMIAKYQPSEHSWKQVWFYNHADAYRRGPRGTPKFGWVWKGQAYSYEQINPEPPDPPDYGWLPYPAKKHEGRTVKEWADGLEEVDPDVIDRSGRGVQAFGDDGVPYLIVQAQKHPPGAELRGLIASFLRVPAAGQWRQPAIDMLHELLNDTAQPQPTRDRARNALKQAGLK
jgi:hypothetical protein